ncbi:MAG: cyclic nucleotide-binding domain-containing protein [Deltaproteobacteria bacterium]|nr:cyclic nucleotide-binding domain-containing protein [Deltaproteobacteria bacterium]
MTDVVALPRGGLWLMTPLGALQLGAPPDSLKDTLTRADGVPRIVVLPQTLVDVRKGTCTADVEFPIYFNLFVKQRPLIVVGRKNQEARVKAAVQESLLGPLEQDVTDDVAAGRHVPNLMREQAFFRKGNYKTGVLGLDDAIDFRVAPDSGERTVLEIDGKKVELARDDDGWSVWFDGELQARLPLDPPPATIDDADDDADPITINGLTRFKPPEFGVTVLGRSHGFDPDPRERTTGFVLWIGGRGVLVDPPLRSTELLREADIDHGLVDSLILTHVHADHDAGTLQKAIEAGRVILFTAPVIFASWLRKWSALSGIPEVELRKLFDFRPVQVGKPVDVNGAKLLFRFTLHSIPTITFEAHYEGASFNYSGDTLNDGQAIDRMFEQGFMDKERREELSAFDWSHDLIFHESGVAPLHTPLPLLDALDDDTKRRVRVLHVTPGRMKGHPTLIVAEPGREATIDLPTEPPPDQRVLRQLMLLGRTRLFSHLPIARAAELLAAAKEQYVPAGEQFITRGSDGGDLYVVTGGKASVQRDGRELKVYGLGDYIGETAVFLRQPRNADVKALTDLELLRVDGAVARRICHGTDIPKMVERHDRVRQMDAWGLLEENPLLRGMTTTQKNDLESLLDPFEAQSGSWIVRDGDVATRLPLILEGEAVLSSEHAPSPPAASADAVIVKRGAIVGDVVAFLAEKPQPEGAVAHGVVRGFYLGRADLEALLEDNPGLRVRLQPWTAHESSTVERGMARMVTEHLQGH